MKLPPVLRATVELEPRERVLAVADLAGGAVAAATTHRLLVQGSPALRWTEVTTAALNADDRVLEIDLVDGARAVLVLAGADRALAATVHERVRHSILLTRVVELGRRRTVRVVARREPGGDPFVQVVTSPGVSVDGPDAAAAVAEAEVSVREQVGLA